MIFSGYHLFLYNKNNKLNDYILSGVGGKTHDWPATDFLGNAS